MKKRTARTSKNSVGPIVRASPISPTNAAIYEAGKSLLIGSVTTSGEFCKSMSATCIGAIPVYIGLIKFLLPEHYAFNLAESAIGLAPAVFFLISAIIFAIGYYPRKAIISLDYPKEIESERRRIVDRRRILSIIAFAVFSLSILMVVAISAFFLRWPESSQASV